MRSLKCEDSSLKWREVADLRSAAPPVSWDFRLQTSNFKLGFSLVETLAASMILSGAVLTLGAISTNALTSTRLHRHYEHAASVIDLQLSLIDFVGIEQFIEAGQMEGVNDQFEPGYQWAVTTEYAGTDNLYMVKITVTWLEGKRSHSITAQTMLNGASLASSTGTEESQAE
jgi:Tfp pilus assembly protein PilV